MTSPAHGILSSDISNWNTSYSNASQALGTGATPTFLGLSLGSSGLNTAGTGIFNNLKLNSGGALRTGTNAGDTLLFNVYNTGSSTYTNFATLTAGANPTMDLASNVTIGGNTIMNSSLANVANGYVGINGSGIANIGSIGLTYTAAPIYQSSVVYQDPSASFSGDGSYSGYVIKGSYTTITTNININQYIGNVWTHGSDAVTVNIYVFNSMPSGLYSTMASGLVYTTTIANANFPKSSNANGNTINLGSNVAINMFPSGTTYLFITFGTPSASEVAMGNWVATHTGYHNNGLFLSDGTTIFFGSSTYLQPGFQLNGLNDITKTVNISLGSNLVTNPGFESGLTGWLHDGNGDLGAIVLSPVYSGSNALQLVSANSNWYTPQRTQLIAVSPSSSSQLSFWTKGDGTNSATYAVYDMTHASWIIGPGARNVGNTSTSWVQYITTFTIPAGCTSVRLYLTVAQASSATTYFDDVSLKNFIPGYTYNQIPLSSLLNGLPAAGISFADPNGIMTSTNVWSGIVEAYNHASAPSASSAVPTSLVPRIILPTEIVAVVGDELQIFARGVIEAMDPYALPYNFTSTVGNQYPRYWDYTPVIGDVGTKTLTVAVQDLTHTNIASASTNIVVVNATGQPSSNKNVLVIGDSLTGGGTWPQEAYRRLTQSGGTPAGKGYSNITFLGDVPMSSYPTQGYVAWGGWSYGQHMGTASPTGGYVLTGTFNKDRTDENAIYAYGTSQFRIMETQGQLMVALYSGSDVLPSGGGTLTWVSGGTHTTSIVYTSYVVQPAGSVFWDNSLSRVNFQSWLTRVGGSGNIDVAYILLGWNEIGTGPNATDHATAITSAKALIDRLHTDYPSCLIRLLGVEVPSEKGGLGANYGSNGGLSDYYNTVRNANGYNLAMASIAADASYSSFVKFLGISSQFDTEYNMSYSATAVNTRNATTENRGTNGVHPATAGYYQIADVVYRDFIRTFSSN